MADSKVSSLTASDALAGSELFYADGLAAAAAADVKVTATQIKTWCLATPTIAGHPTIEGVVSTGATGTGKFVFDGTPTLVTPVLGAATGTSVTLSAFAKLTGVAVGSLNGSPAIGMVQTVTDALTPIAGQTVSDGGAANALVWYNGANWTVIGV